MVHLLQTASLKILTHLKKSFNNQLLQVAALLTDEFAAVSCADDLHTAQNIAQPYSNKKEPKNAQESTRLYP